MKNEAKFLTLLICLFPSFAASNPAGSQITHGEVSIKQDTKSQLLIESRSDRAVIEWDRFSIEEGEEVLITLPKSDSAILLKIKGESTINGTLASNGIIYIENEKGITFGLNSDASCSEFYGVGFSLDSEQFIDHHPLKLDSASDSTHLIKGTIRAAVGDIVLVASKIIFEGSISSPQKVALIAEDLRLESGSKINCYSSNKGGTVLIGGDFQGKSLEIPNAKRIYFDRSACVDVNAQEFGDGGNVILFSEESTQFFGTILARGGAHSGNGGFVEVSSHGFLDFQGLTDRSAPEGKAGTLLLDPSDIALGTVTSTNVSLGPTITATASSASLKESDLQNQLNLGNVIVTTVSPYTGNGDIYTNGNLSLDLRGHTLTFNAERDFILGDEFELRSTPGGTLNINAGRNYIQHALGINEARIESNVLTNLNISAAQDVIFELGASSIAFVEIDIRGPVSIIAGRDILLDNNCVTFSNARFLVIDCYNNGSVLMQAGRNISVNSVIGSNGVNFGANASPGEFKLIAEKNITFGNLVSTRTITFGERPNIFTLVVDNENPTFPSIGLSSLTLQGEGINLRTNGTNNIRFFTARREQNSIGSNVLINGTSYVPGTLFVNTATEQWETYYPSIFGGVPYTIFYKNGFVPPPSDLTGAKSKNQFVGQTEYIHTLHWLPSTDPNVVSYNVYVNGQFYTNVSASAQLEAVMHNRCKKKCYTYEVKAVTAAGDESSAIILVLCTK